MGFKGFLESDYVPTLFSGKYDSTYGTQVNFTLGSAYDHTFGSEARMFADPLSVIPGSSALSLILGPTGKVDFTLGSETSIGYGGPEYSIQRSVKYAKWSDVDYSTPEEAVKTSAKVTGRVLWKTEPVEVPLATVVATLSVLMCCISLACDLALHFRYPKFGSEDKDDEDTIDGYGLTPKILKAIAFLVVDRMLGVIRLLELKAGYVTAAIQEGDDLGSDVVASAGSLAGFRLVVGVSAANVKNAQEHGKAVANDAAKVPI